MLTLCFWYNTKKVKFFAKEFIMSDEYEDIVDEIDEDEDEIYTPETNRDKLRMPTKYIKEDVYEEEKVEKSYIKLSKEDFMVFCRGLMIASQDGPRIFENCMALFQRKCFDEMKESLQALRDGDIPEHQRWWIERTKKGSKDADMAIVALWLIAFPRRPFYAQVAAADGEQAGIVKNRINVLLHLNPWLNDYVELIHSKIRSKSLMANGAPMAYMDVINTDIAGSHGETPDLLIINELSHIEKWEFVENLMSNAAGVARGMTLIATNAGFKGTKADNWRRNAITSEDWMVHCLSKPAPWHSNKFIQDEKRRNTYGKFLRLWKGKWVSGKGDALNEEDIEACFCLVQPTLVAEPGWEYIAGLDLGIRHDHSALMVLGINFADQKLRVVYWRAWAPRKDREVDLNDVENECILVARRYRLNLLFYDPHQAALMAQRLRKRSVPMKEMTFSRPSNLTKMATCLIQVTEARKLECYDDEDGRLRSDLAKFSIVEKSYGYKLEAVSDETGHADVGTALVICLPYAVDALGLGGSRLLPEDDIVETDDSPLTQEEVEELPEEFKELYEMDLSEEADEFV
jgi:hypothetical protein